MERRWDIRKKCERQGPWTTKWGKCSGKWDGKTSKLLSAPRSLTLRIQVLLRWVFGFRKDIAGNSDLLNGNLDKMSGWLILLIVTEIALVQFSLCSGILSPVLLQPWEIEKKMSSRADSINTAIRKDILNYRKKTYCATGVLEQEWVAAQMLLKVNVSIIAFLFLVPITRL